MGLLLVISLALTGVTIVIHGAGTTFWLRHLTNKYANMTGSMPPRLQLRLIIVTAMLLICLHFVEIMLWAGTYLLVARAEIVSLEAAAYFSAVTFTTLGYGDITLGSEWRLLSGFEAINGILLIGWTTAFLFAVLQKIWGNLQQNQNRENNNE